MLAQVGWAQFLSHVSHASNRSHVRHVSEGLVLCIVVSTLHAGVQKTLTMPPLCFGCGMVHIRMTAMVIKHGSIVSITKLPGRSALT